MKYEDAVPLIENLPEYKALEDEEGRRAAFAKFIKRQKVCTACCTLRFVTQMYQQERIREAALSDDGGSTTSRKRKEPVRGHDEERERDHKDRDRDRGDKRDRDAHRGDRERERTKDYRSSRHHHRYDDYDADHRHGPSARDYGREKDDYRSSKYHRDEKDGYDKKRDRDARDVRDPRDGGRERRPSRDERGTSHPPHWDEPPRGPPGRERSTSIYKDDYVRDKREQEDSVGSDRAEKVSFAFVPFLFTR